jgi:hypothetical protein
MPPTLWQQKGCPAGETIRVWCYERPQIRPRGHRGRHKQKLYIRQIAADTAAQKSHAPGRDVPRDPGAENACPHQIGRNPVGAHPLMQGTTTAAGVNDWRGYVVLNILSDTLECYTNWNIIACENRWVPDTGHHQQVRRTDNPGRKEDFPLSMDGVLLALV